MNDKTEFSEATVAAVSAQMAEYNVYVRQLAAKALAKAVRQVQSAALSKLTEDQVLALMGVRRA